MPTGVGTSQGERAMTIRLALVAAVVIIPLETLWIILNNYALGTDLALLAWMALVASASVSAPIILILMLLTYMLRSVAALFSSREP